jgi:hypothetical protein
LAHHLFPSTKINYRISCPITIHCRTIKNWCLVAPWKFRLRFEASGLPPLKNQDPTIFLATYWNLL